MRAHSWIRALDFFIEACWLLALVAVPIYFDTLTSRIFEPDKIVLFRNIVLLMVLATLLRGVIAAPGALARSGAARPVDDSAEGTAQRTTSRGPWWRREAVRRPLLAATLLFVIVYTAATLHSVLPGISFWGSYDRMQGLYTWLSYIAFFLILSYNVRSWAQIERVISAIVFASVPVALYGIMQHLTWDPVAWGADTSTRVASTLGNAIFLGAYLIMTMPFAGYRLWRAVDRWRAPTVEGAPGRTTGRAGANGAGRRAPQRSAPARQKPKDTIEITGLHPSIPVIGYSLVLIVSFAALYFCGSRGPYYGFIVAILALGVLLTVKLENPYPFMVGGALAVVLFLFPGIMNLLNPVVAILLFLVGVGLAVFRVKSPYPALAGLGLAIAIFTFPQAVNIVAPPPPAVAAATGGGGTASTTKADAQHLSDFSDTGDTQVRFFIWHGSIPLILHNLLLGYGPETMIYVYSPYYPAGLGHLEHANAAPDRNHDVWLDFLVFSGILGLLAWLLLLATFAFVAYKVLRRARSRRAVLLAAILPGVVIGHLVEATVGIPIVSTLLLLWTMFALATALYARPELLGAARPRTAEEVAAADEAAAAAAGIIRKGQGRSGAPGARPARRTGPAPRPVAAASFERLTARQQGGLLGFVLLTLAALIGGSLLFSNNLNVVRADAAYKQGQSYDSVGLQCLGQPYSCPIGGLQATTPQQAQNVIATAGTQIIPQAITFFDQATSQQSSQDMYDLWKGKAYLDEAQYYLGAHRQSDAVAQLQNADDALQRARHLNPYNADHPMNLGRMFTFWAENIDASKWSQADTYYRLATGPQLAYHNGRWADEWGIADMTQAGQQSLSPAARATFYEQALATFQHASAVDDQLGDARGLHGDALMALGRYPQAAASFAEALRVGNFEPLPGRGQWTDTPGKAVQQLISALYGAHDYKGLVSPLYAGGKKPLYGGASPVTLATSPTIQADFTPDFTGTLQTISTTLRQKGLVK